MLWEENVLALRKYILKYVGIKGYHVHYLLSNRSGKISIDQQKANVKANEV